MASGFEVHSQGFDGVVGDDGLCGAVARCRARIEYGTRRRIAHFVGHVGQGITTAPDKGHALVSSQAGLRHTRQADAAPTATAEVELRGLACDFCGSRQLNLASNQGDLCALGTQHDLRGFQ